MTLTIDSRRLDARIKLTLAYPPTTIFGVLHTQSTAAYSGLISPLKITCTFSDLEEHPQFTTSTTSHCSDPFPSMTSQYITNLVLIKSLRGITGSASAIGQYFFAPELPTPSEVTFFISGTRKLPIHIYLPRTTDAAVQKLPVYINLHGGGFCIPGLGYDAEFCAYIANTVNCVVVDGDYSKGPELPWPSAVDDVDALIRWVRGNAEERGWDFERASIGGFSSGACLALLGAAGQEGKDLKAVAAFYPSYVKTFEGAYQ